MTSRAVSRIALAARLSALVATSFFLIATSEVPPPNQGIAGASGTSSSGYGPCSHSHQSVTFHVTGTCGPEGDVTLTSLANDCAISVQGGGDVGLPSAGRFSSTGNVSLTASDWVLSGYMPEGTVLPGSGTSDAPFIVIGAPQATGGTATVAHGSLVKRTCRSVSGSTATPVSCVHEASSGVAGCNATFTLRK